MADARAQDFAALLDEREEIARARSVAARSALESVTVARDGASGDDEHDPEGETLSLQWTRAQAIAQSADEEIDRLARARAALADGRYGVCETCGAPIPLGRLEALPFTTMCVACAARA